MKVPERTVVAALVIGQQAAGATSTAWTQTYIRFCEAQRRRVEVVETADDGASRLTLAVGAPGTLRDAVVRSPVLRLRVVEARWAEAFEAPTALSVLKWLLWYGPNLAFAQVFLTRRAHRWLREATEHTIAETAPEAELTTADAAAHRAASSATSLVPVLYLLGGLVLLAVAGPLVLVLGVLALLAALVPSDTVRAAAARVLGVVSAQVGDVSTFLSSPVARGAMEDIV